MVFRLRGHRRKVDSNKRPGLISSVVVTRRTRSKTRKLEETARRAGFTQEGRPWAFEETWHAWVSGAPPDPGLNEAVE